MDGWFGEKTLRCSESSILPEETVYVLGTAQENRGAAESTENSDRLYIGSSRDHDFIISDRSEKELLSRLRWQVLRLPRRRPGPGGDLPAPDLQDLRDGGPITLTLSTGSEHMNGTLILGTLLVFGIVGIIVYAVGLYNTLVRLSNNIDKAWSNIDVMLKQRHDELPKLVDVCNSYMKHERRHAGRRHQCPNRL